MNRVPVRYEGRCLLIIAFEVGVSMVLVVLCGMRTTKSVILDRGTFIGGNPRREPLRDGAWIREESRFRDKQPSISGLFDIGRLRMQPCHAGRLAVEDAPRRTLVCFETSDGWSFQTDARGS